MKRRIAGGLLVAVAALTISLSLSSTAPAALVDKGLLIDVRVDLLPLGDAPATLANTGSVVGDFSLVNQPGMPPPQVEDIAGIRGIHINKDAAWQNIYEGPVAPSSVAGNNARSIEVWAYNPAVAGEEMLVAWARRGATGRNMSFGYGTHESFGAVGHWGGGPDVGWNDAGGAPAGGEWHHLVYTYDPTDGPGTTRVYSDGVEENFDANGALDAYDGFTFLIGGQHANNAPFGPTVEGQPGGLGGGNYRGLFASVRIHDGVLSPDDIANNFAEGVPLAIPEPSTLVLSALGLLGLLAVRRRRRM
ncbi:MAG: LamG domain-containing protein [Planctomycetes bacterium]|nr:LamG domain-containing protein [Planctomycetota bacterium]